MRAAETGHYSTRIIDVHPRNGAKLPANEHFYAFFSRFGSILEVYHQESRGTSKADHTYVVFKTDEALPVLKRYMAGKEAPSFWKETCNIVSGITKCPAPLIRLIESREGRGPGIQQQGSSSKSTWKERGQINTTGANAIPIPAGLTRRPEADVGLPGRAETDVHPQNQKRNRDDVATEPEPQNKKAKFFDDTETSDSAPTTDSLPAYAPSSSDDNVPPSRPEDTSHVQSLKRETASPYPPPTQKSALELAQEANKLASTSRTHDQGPSRPEDTRAEIERLEAELDEARAENEKLRAQRNAEATACEELRQELDRLKKSVKEKASKSDTVLRLVTASLQSLQADTAEILEP